MSGAEPTKPESKPRTQLYCIIARNAPIAVIFRRGPSKSVQLIKWNLRNDTFEMGQWLKGRIYERRCDLSPDGSKLIYFAANWKPKKGPLSWTAISHPPYLSALAMWPKGDGWGGGGHFQSENTILLNHRTHEMTLGEGFWIPKRMQIKPFFGEYSGGGEDDPIHAAQLTRDGWEMVQAGSATLDWNADITWKYDTPRIYQKPMPHNQKYLLQAQTRGVDEKQKSWYLIDHEIMCADGTSILKLPRTSWADWDSDGDLLYADAGKLFRLSAANIKLGDPASDAKELANFEGQRFTEMPPPPEALKW